jgi:hypothetical protein
MAWTSAGSAASLGSADSLGEGLGLVVLVLPVQA